MTGLLPNVVIFLALYSNTWTDGHVPTWLALGVLYAGPAVAGAVGLARVLANRARRRGAGLITAALLTVGLWFAWVQIDMMIFMQGASY